MNWIDESFEKEKKQRPQEQPARKQMASPPKELPAWLKTWEQVVAALRSDVSHFNNLHGQDQFRVTPLVDVGRIVQIVPGEANSRHMENAALATTVLQIESGQISLTQPPAREGIGRRGNFKAQGDAIVALPNFTGNPKPPVEAMTPDEFSKFVLKPLLFPDLK